jgi:hypothetical protein
LEVREDLVFKRLAVDEEGKGLVWIGEISQQDTADKIIAVSPAASALPPPVMATDTQTNVYRRAE